MKKTIITCSLSLLFFSFCYSQSSCSKYYPLEEGTSFQITNYNKKGKVTGFTDYLVTNSRTENEFQVVTLNLKMQDKKRKHITGSSYDIKCNSEGVIIDYKSMSNTQMFSQFENFEYEMSGTDINLPNKLFVGQELPDSNMHMIISMGITMEMDVTIKNRKIIAEETITTPAGTFNCYVITSSLDMNMGMKVTGSSKQWLAEGFGMVKQESYDKNKKLTSSSQLTIFNK